MLKQINALRPDLVFAGNQHSYERFYPMGIPQEDGSLPVVRQSKYTKGAGVSTDRLQSCGRATGKALACDKLSNHSLIRCRTLF